jgi:hypothetical protein
MVVNNQHDLVIRVRMETLKAQQKIKELQQSSRHQYKRIAEQQEKIRQSTLKMNKALGQFPFAGWAMSIMFAGMALQRMSMSLYKFGTKAFQEISHSVEGTVTNTDMLQGSMKYLGFTVGQALEPVVAFLIPIIDKISEWIERNPELTSGIIAWGGTFGALMMAGGSIKLATDGIAGLIEILKLTNWTKLGDKVTKGIGLIAIAYSFMKADEAYDDFKEGKVIKGLINALSAGALAVGGYAMFRGMKWGLPVLAIGIMLDVIQQGKFFTYLLSIFGLIFAGFETLVQQITHNFRAGLMEGILGSLMDLLYNLSGLPIFEKLGFSFAADIKNLKNSLKAEMGIGEFDYTAKYLENYAKGVEKGKSVDATIMELLNKPQIIIQEQNVYANDKDELLRGIESGVGI